MKNYKLLWGIIALLLLVLTTIAYRLVSGSVVPSEDNRIALRLFKDERNLVLAEMRQFLITTQAVSEAITNNDLKQAAKLASESGMQAEADTPRALLIKIPLAMKTMGFDTRQKFDQLAIDALQFNNAMHSRKQLDTLMNNCNACHASFKITETEH
jgi:multidrug efflux pump subunit AcrB